jgi:putative FmdB family regulatory protein
VPIYQHRCPCCDHVFEVVKRMSELDRPEGCPECELSCGPDTRIMQRFGFTGASDWNRQEFNHGLGQVATPRQAEKIAKAKGWEPAGDTKLGTIHKHAETTQADRRKAIWDDDRIKA